MHLLETEFSPIFQGQALRERGRKEEKKVEGKMDMLPEGAESRGLGAMLLDHCTLPPLPEEPVLEWDTPGAEPWVCHILAACTSAPHHRFHCLTLTRAVPAFRVIVFSLVQVHQQGPWENANSDSLVSGLEPEACSVDSLLESIGAAGLRLSEDIHLKWTLTLSGRQPGPLEWAGDEAAARCVPGMVPTLHPHPIPQSWDPCFPECEQS